MICLTQGGTLAVDGAQRGELIRAREVIRAQLDELQLRSALMGTGTVSRQTSGASSLN